MKRVTALVALLCVLALLCACGVKEPAETTAPSAPETAEEKISVTIPINYVADKDTFIAELDEFGGITCEEIEDAYLLTATASTYEAFMTQKRERACADFDETVKTLPCVTDYEINETLRMVTVTVTPGEYTVDESRPVLADAAVNLLVYQLYTGENLFVTVKIFDTEGEVVDSFQLPTSPA